jgi:hypothetical protein
MKAVKRMADIVRLQEKGEQSEAYLKFLEEYFLQLYESFGEGEGLDKFSLEHDRAIVILDSNDNLKDLRVVGLSQKDGGLYGTFPEYIEKETLVDGKQLWKVGVFHDNGSMQIFFSQIGELDKEAEAWMEYHDSSELFSGGFQR